MSQYLDVSDTSFVGPGIFLNEALIERASAIIDGYCRREIGVKTYKERIPLTNFRGHVSFYPVIEVLSAEGRSSQGIMGGFFGPPTFVPIELSAIDMDKSIGSVWCGHYRFGSPMAELEIEYTSGWEDTPHKVKVACGMLISQLAVNANPNIKSKKDFDFSIEYFGSNLITPDIANLLAEYRIMFMR
jgi:hypothetical protein